MLKICKNSIVIFIRGSSYEFTSALSKGLNVNVICMEYPGYGIY